MFIDSFKLDKFIMLTSSSKITQKLLNVLIMSTILKHFSSNGHETGHEQVEANAISSRINLNSNTNNNNNNRMRYGRSETSKNLPHDQLVQLTTASAFAPTPSSIEGQSRDSTYSTAYRINRDLTEVGREGKYQQGKLLDEEDKSLLEKFYKETKERDPFLGDSLDTETLWREREHEGTDDGLLDFEDDQMKENKGKLDHHHIEPIVQNHLDDGWTVDDDDVGDDDYSSDEKYHHYPHDEYHKPLNTHKKHYDDSHQANYSPHLKLLTSYNPVEESPHNNDANLPLAEHDAIVGATLFGEQKDARPKVKSKSAHQAIQLHDELMKPAPKDGKVRVRMYYHRAIHDDAKLFGTGPWKYWGHGWGVEYGFDPKSEFKNKDYYQKGYTIERAFGRDFCKDKKNCRQPDPDFFKNPHNVGKYSKKDHYMSSVGALNHDHPHMKPKHRVTRYKIIY